MLAQCDDELKMAAAAAQSPEEKQRVALFARCFAFSESLFDLAAKPTDETLRDRAVALAQDLAKDPWTFYVPAAPKQPVDHALEAIQAIYKGIELSLPHRNSPNSTPARRVRCGP